MTTQRSFKRLVRARMEKTGERYAAARAAILAPDEAKPVDGPTLSMSDEAIRRRTGEGWEGWFDLLDASPVAGVGHTEIARWVSETRGIDGWSAQAVTVGYERARGGRAVGQRPDGFEISVTKTIGVPVERLYEHAVDERVRASWLVDGQLRPRTTIRPKSARFDWVEDGSRVLLSFLVKAGDRSSITATHQRLADGDAAARMKTYWRDRLDDLQRALEG